MLDKSEKAIIYEQESTDNLDKDRVISSLMDEYGDSVIRLAYTYVKDKQMAEDVAQEVFIKCYKKIETFRHDSSYKTWMYRITINKCKDVLKSWSLKNILLLDTFIYKEKNRSSSPETNLLKNEENHFISIKVLELPVKLREVVILHYYEDLNIREISHLIKTNQNTVKSRLYQARQKLKKVLGGDKLE
ncbi:sigma-70 family RNA polymerase sigma factor [Halobacillus amylolyticus]|uniref:Sigma-70 family RNA polymerase sigma factor n=1 Tax=Halobacillus amylolyticus TaxID=2932259 RepID=A0ABY4HB62_9BACI|nr:sigma-70 family RNA polymerase sigma factor [Halobacillus amylolyticus]UOR10640.1 sigma-70 family RNA polymerase sigma factor [Halobacillus amylolyticus]